MGRGVENQALAASGENAIAAKSALATLSPTLTSLSSGTVGMTPQQKANALTSGAQSVGGSVSGAVGLGNLEAARTGNIGGYTASLDDAASQGMDKNADIALGEQNQSDQIARDNQKFALSGLNNVYSGAAGRQISALDPAEQASMGVTNTVLGGVNAAANLLSGGSGAAKMFGGGK